ncbi:lysine-specific demethylase lid-like [Cimex lectularius]|uniref:Lysine-specific demethylase rbr-2 n=1 Tax=Cimex lectularius TaxID=79782 RepID=A0A8I6RQ59_CIMLE|nr:lysine-specific demethylase lid-like [Cimex lectularius]
MERKASKSGPQTDVLDSFEFVMPPEAPFFQPTRDEFKDPLAFIDKIRPIAETSGICRIKPPQDWQPPFAVDIGKFLFTPRVQRLNELEAKTRIRLNFLDQIAKFWELQGTPLKIPMVERKILDLYTLHQIVKNEGGFATVTKQKLWGKVAIRMGMPKGRGISSVLKGHYEKILSPFDIFEETKVSKDKIDEHLKDSLTGSKNELKRLQIYGAGPKMAGFNIETDKKDKSKKATYDQQDPLAKYICQVCERGDEEETMLLCDGCDDSYHTFCLVPPLTEIPKGDWRCPKCVAEEVSKPMDPFGFEQAQREYTLQQFGEMADIFKANYFNMPVHRVPLPLVEKEFWRIVSSIDEDVTVEYGADLHTVDHGSGFPTKDSHSSEMENPDILQYIESPWNLNNMPVLQGSVLSHISANISGMKVPWMYVGMCFATFCWHNEDHWSYSINYLHWGEPKTWYGVPGSYAEQFEATMKQVAPELFQTQPDLLHQLTTIMNPNVLMKAGVPVYRTDQEAGEFVITFPRAYHAGFNQGYNFAEAVNFAPADWLSMGRECITRYASLHRFCVFSHDELVCKIALNASSIDPKIAAATYDDMLKMVEMEKNLRKKLLGWGVCEAEREAYELVPDDGRQCYCCKTTCFLSAVTCKCSTDKLVCLHHFDSLCDCPPKNHILRYRYTMDELPAMLQKLKEKAEIFEVWIKKAKRILNHEMCRSIDLNGLKALLTEAKDRQFPDSELLHSLINAVQEAEKCSNIAQRLNSNKERVRTRICPEKKMTVDELTLFIKEVNNLVCKIEQGDSLNSWLHQALHFQKHASLLLSMDSVLLEQLKTAKQEGISLNLEFEELDLINKEIEIRSWIEKADAMLVFDQDTETSDLSDMIKNGISLLKTNIHSMKHQQTLEDCISKLQILLRLAEKWESKAKHLLNAKSEDKLYEFENHLIDGKYIPVKLYSHSKLANAIALTKAWYKDVESICEVNMISNKNELQHLIERAASLPININVDKLKNNLVFRDKWIAEVCKAFLKNGDQELIEVLFPRIRNLLQDEKQFTTSWSKDFSLCDIPSLKTEWFTSFYKKATARELSNLKSLRIKNKQVMMNSKDVSRHCFCKSKKKGALVKCILCSITSHEICVSKNWKCKDNMKSNYLIMNYICQDCERSKRPPLNVIKSLIADLQNTNIKFPEGEALKLLMERIKAYKTKVEKVLQNKNLIEVKPFGDHRKKRKIKEETDDVCKEDLKLPKEISTNKNCDETSDTTGVNQEEDEPPKTFSHSVNILKSGLKLSKDDLSVIKSLLHEGSAIEASIIHTSFLLKLLKVAKQKPIEKRKPNQDSVLNVYKKDQNMKTNGNLKKVDYKQRKNKGILSLVDNKNTVRLNSHGNSSKSNLTKSSVTLMSKVKTKDAKGLRNERRLNKHSQEESLSADENTCDNLLKPSTEPLIKDKPKRDKRPQKTSKKGSHEGDNTQEDGGGGGDDDEDCALPNCLRPVGVKVDWVQCDQCLCWYHLLCIKLKKSDVKEDQDFFCHECKKNSRFPRKCKK